MSFSVRMVCAHAWVLVTGVPGTCDNVKSLSLTLLSFEAGAVMYVPPGISLVRSPNLPSDLRCLIALGVCLIIFSFVFASNVTCRCSEDLGNFFSGLSSVLPLLSELLLLIFTVMSSSSSSARRANGFSPIFSVGVGRYLSDCALVLHTVVSSSVPEAAAPRSQLRPHPLPPRCIH